MPIATLFAAAPAKAGKKHKHSPPKSGFYQGTYFQSNNSKKAPDTDC